MKYFRFTNEEEDHNGFKYKTGLNVDTIAFNPCMSCGAGLYFFGRDNISDAPCNVNPCISPLVWVREVILPEDARHMDLVHKHKADKFILGPRRRITLRWLCEEFTLKEVEVFCTSHPNFLARFKFFYTLTADEFLECANEYNFSSVLRHMFANLYQSYFHYFYGSHGWSAADLKRVRDLSIIQKRKQPERACKNRRIAV